MISHETLTQAIARGVITAEQADQIRALASADAPPQDEEKLRFITGFGDIFVSIGLILFFIAVLLIGGNTGHKDYLGGAISIFAWVFSEIFSRRQKLALPSILLTVIFLFGIFFQLSILFYGDIYIDMKAALTERMLPIPLLFCFGFSPIYYWRFRTPITPALATACLLSAISAYVYWQYRQDIHKILPFIAISFGIGIFAAALRLDLADQNREKTTSDVAFWLHFLSAPLIIHPLMFWIGIFDQRINPFLILGIFLVLSIISLVIDRRSIIVSGMFYAGTAIFYLVETDISRKSGSITWQFTYSVLFIGLFIILISAGWTPIRRILLGLLPPRVRHLLPRAAVRA